MTIHKSSLLIGLEDIDLPSSGPGLLNSGVASLTASNMRVGLCLGT